MRWRGSPTSSMTTESSPRPVMWCCRVRSSGPSRSSRATPWSLSSTGWARSASRRSEAVRLGVTFSHPDLGADPGFLKAFAQAVEEAGFDHLVTAEHVVGGHPDRARDEKVHTYDVPYHEPFVLLGFLGAVTRRLELVTGILILPQRQTVLVAKQAAELDLLTGGRLRLGVGIGRNWMEYEALNEDFSNRGARIEEQVEVLRRLWTEELVTFDGRWHHLDRVGLNPTPAQRPIP